MKSICPWDDIALNISMNLRANYLWDKGDFPEYKKGENIPETEQTSDNLPFVLDKIPNSFLIVR